MSTNEITDKDRYASVTISKEELLKRKRPDRPVWQMVEELLKDIPVDDLERMPTDGAEQHDHYIYGTPKRIQEGFTILLQGAHFITRNTVGPPGGAK